MRTSSSADTFTTAPRTFSTAATTGVRRFGEGRSSARGSTSVRAAARRGDAPATTRSAAASARDAATADGVLRGRGPAAGGAALWRGRRVLLDVVEGVEIVVVDRRLDR